MISKKLLNFKNVFQALQTYSKCSFATFPNRNQRKVIYDDQVPKYTDDLQFPYENAKYNGGFRELTEHLKSNAGFDMKPLNVAYIMYNCALSNLYEPLIFEEIERNLYKYAGRLRPRWAFGCLYGIYKTNAGSTKGIHFFEQEFLSHIQEISSVETVQIVDALSCNTQLSREHKFAFIKSHLQPLLLEKWRRDLEYKGDSMVLLFRALVQLEYFDKELLDILLETIRKKKQLHRTKYAMELYETFSDLQEKGGFYRDLGEDIAHQRQILESRHTVTWSYDLDKRRYRDYFEVKANRDDFKDLNQYTDVYTSQVTEEDIKERREREEKRAQFLREFEKEQAMNDIVKEQYVRLMRGDAETGLEDFEEGDVESEESINEWMQLEEGRVEESQDLTKVKEPKAKLTEEQVAKLKEKQKQEKKARKASLKEMKNEVDT